jgi:hypothetical protein
MADDAAGGYEVHSAVVSRQITSTTARFSSEASRPLEALNDFMLPLIKGYASEKVYELLSLSLQCFGGSGYCQDYPAEQYIRDQRIDSLYEGTTHIQALDLFFRKIGRDRGTTLQALVGQIAATANELPAELSVEKAALQAAMGDVQAIMRNRKTWNTALSVDMAWLPFVPM